MTCKYKKKTLEKTKKPLKINFNFLSFNDIFIVTFYFDFDFYI